MPKGDIRDVSPLLQRLRDFLLGRPHRPNLRWKDDLTTRSPPPPELPDGPAHRLSANYYYTRDARREATPPEVVVAADAKMLGTGQGAVAQKPVKARAPGTVFRWD